MANWDPMESPSGLACDVRRNFGRFRTSLTICRSTSELTRSPLSVPVAFIVSRKLIVSTTAFRALGPLDIQVLQNLFDPVLPLDAGIEEELEIVDAPEAQPPAQLAAKEGSRPFERALALTARFVVAHGRVVHARLLQIGGYLDVGDGEEADARIVHFAREEIRDLDAELITDAAGTIWT